MIVVGLQAHEIATCTLPGDARVRGCRGSLRRVWSERRLEGGRCVATCVLPPGSASTRSGCRLGRTESFVSHARAVGSAGWRRKSWPSCNVAVLSRANSHEAWSAMTYRLPSLPNNALQATCETHAPERER